MAQANIKDRIKEMRLRVLAEPLGEAAAKMDGKISPEDDILGEDIKAHLDNPKTDALVKEKITETRSAKKTKPGKKKTSKKSQKQEHKEAPETVKNMSQLESNAQTDVRVEEIGEFDINLQAEIKEPLKTTEPIDDDNALDKNKKSPGEIIELTDKWVELEVRSRLSGLEQQEKQTRAMLKEIVEILDRIETPKYSNKASPVVSDKKLLPTSSTSQTSETKKRHWTDIIKRIFVVIATFVIFAGVIWGSLLYLFFGI